ncbi:T9SS type A sorting domain-containing protein [Aequorivita marina]|uniref:T9SS type A sorting domain-containing protein n=1 Tax=Aequorivita marina TaxID=3073654 RepID=UPI002875D4ED|nr:T9SS type A sorting domain-containing protein [Aequorivita sp. S2608]MDS1298915.1 T9SS type A sorting domain-containing protein [Aequorivita sp. S2608]
MNKLYTLLLLIVTTSVTLAQPGTLDPTFGTDGIVTTAIDPNYNFAEATIVQADGKIVVAGNAGTPADFRMAIARYNTDGSLDSSFGNGGNLHFNVGAVKSFIMDLAQQPDGKIVIGGRTWDNESGNFALVRLNEDGSFDDTFGTNGIAHIITSEADVSEKISLLDDGKIIVAGYRDNNFAVAKFNADGSVDSTFGINGWYTFIFENAESFATDIAIQNDDKVVISGFAHNTDNRFQITAARLTADGNPDSSFGTNGKVIFNVGDWNDFGESIAIQSDGKILIAGHKWIANAQQRHDFFVAKLNTNGSLDTSYGDNGVGTARLVDGANYTSEMVLQADEKPVLVGSTVLNGEYNSALVRFDTDGFPDFSFGDEGMTSIDVNGREDYGEAIALQADEKIIVAGYSYTASGSDSEFVVTRFLNDGMVGTEDFQNLEFNLYPNPATDQLTLELNDATSTYQIDVFDVLGKRVISTEIQKVGTINVSALAPGTYVLKLNSDNKANAIRFVKQ